MAKTKAAARRDETGDEAGNGKLKKKDYLERLAPLQLALSEAERWVAATGQRLLVIVEGRDTAGKGGVIHAIAETLNPATAASSRSTSPRKWSVGSGTSSATSPTCPRRARSSSWTAAGTTGPASRR